MTPGFDRSDHDRREGLPCPRRGVTRSIMGAIRHDRDLAALVDVRPERWSEALPSEARAQIGGCLNALELTVALHVAKAPFDAMVGELGPAFCRQAIEREPHLLTPGLVDHMRLRAALALFARAAYAREAPPEAETDGGPAGLADAGALGETFVALTLAESAWLAMPAYYAPVRPDLPAEPFEALAWAVGALFVQACEQRVGAPSPTATQVIAEATRSAIVRHDEGTGAFALAERCARAVPQGERRQIAALALAERRLLLFAALVSAETGVALETLLDALFDRSADIALAMFRHMGIERILAHQALVRIAAVTGHAPDDAARVDLSERYQALDGTSARLRLARLEGPAALVSRLALMERPRA